ncbi:hypothetical protein BO94DRAFT_470303 [Aspergillus sclerotioniger CBS 115572]|uniref:Choline monooxygenase, chloroplastic n=1 Tax=Aspergillus sclerotioniger CBS 115572 TaxID=1450535 RepID=A0A317W6I0_9EURO|nr:hypothetical protein BO94DRAFT_470303 [Aspergillus sclerotioniger CBS 115572]PWY80922.1 hypothetical protein BO94DRAFT_470303 [Aspergillus sclerotioniger CBS 115572]
MSGFMCTLPASWYCSLPLYQLERRAIFLKSWYLMGPVTRFCDIGTKGTPLQHHVTPTGLVFATLSDEAPSFNEYFPDLEPLLEKVNFTKLPYRHSIRYEGRFNWKTMYIALSLHIVDPEKPDDGLFLYFFPNCTLNVYGGGMSSFRVCPTDDPNVTRMEFDYYHMESGDKFGEYFRFVRQVAMEDYELCEKAQDNLTKGIYSEGILNPEKESGVSCDCGPQVTVEMIMERLSSALSPALSASVLVALLVGLIFLLQAFSRPRFGGHRSRHETESKVFDLGPAKEGNDNIVSKESDFPEDWWTGSNVFELERRAIFGKRWLYIAHRSRFSKAGDYHSFEVAGIPIFLVLGKDGNVRAFHNVCRHRAYTITRKESGSSMVLGCRYHGWSYNTNGQLIKAPHFDNVSGFDKSQNGLFSIHTTTTHAGFIFVNLDACPTVLPVETSSLDSFASRYGIERHSTWLGGQTIEGQFNWKLSCELPLQLLHEAPQSKYKCLSSRLFNPSRMCLADIRVFPFTTFHTIEGTKSWYSLSFVPMFEKRTLVRFDLYSHGEMGGPRSPAIQEDLFTHLSNSIQTLEMEFQSYSGNALYVLQPYSQVNLWMSLPSHSRDQSGTILDILRSHARLEKQRGAEVFPATRKPRRNARFEQAEQRQSFPSYFRGLPVLLN